MRRRTKLVLGALAVSMLACAGWCLGVPCWLAWLRWGFLPDTCSAGDPRLVVDVNTYGLERDREGSIYVYARASYVERGQSYPFESVLYRYSAEAELEANGKTYPLDCDWDGSAGSRYCSTKLPKDIPDGDHVLWVSIDSSMPEDAKVKVDLPLYRPALLHVLTDRPLYEPGDDILFRSIALSRADLSPIDDRPGTWIVTDPSGEVLLEERSKGGPWGIASSSFPLSDDAQVGAWTITWRSGDDVASATVAVQPFTLPRFTVEAQSEEPWYGIGDVPAISGRVVYTSGAPVANAPVSVQIVQQGAWPPPNEWTEPDSVTTDRSGNFRYVLPPVPDDLADKAQLGVILTATDAAGDQLRGATSLLFSKDAIAVDAVTELGDGLVPDFNNRAYLRVSTPDGRPLADAEVKVRNPWDPRDKGRELRSDADGVVALKIDPGQPINVLVPAQPLRPVKRGAIDEPVSFNNGREVLTSRSLRINEQVQLEGVERRGELCGRYVSGAREMTLALVVSGGRVTEVAPQSDAASRCMAGALIGLPMGGQDALILSSWSLRPPLSQSRLIATVGAELGSVPEGLAESAEQAAVSAWSCVERAREDADLDLSYLWQVSPGDPRPRIRPIHAGEDVDLPGLDSCLAQHFSSLSLPEPADEAGIGVIRLRVDAPEQERTRVPSPTVMQGFELEVEVPGVGRTLWRSAPGMVPNVRLRPSSVLIAPGEAFEVEILRGPDYQGDLPDGLTLMQGDVMVQSCPRTKKAAKDEDRWSKGCPAPQDDNKVRFSPGADYDGFISAEWMGARSVVYAKPKGALSVDLSTDQAAYVPGANAKLTVHTSSPAVVSLVGLDTALGQLAPLPGPGVLGDSVVTAHSDLPAFGTFDAVALATGRIRGDNAAMAAVQRVTVLNTVSPVAAPSNREGHHRYDPNEELTAAFYELLFDVQRAVRDWEVKAPKDELLTNETMAHIWNEVLDAREEADKPVRDPWNRRLELTMLPDDLLALTDPRSLVRDGTRLPEDVVAWTRWVHEELDQ